uniref:Uncharacterized protein n=1 Tax=Cacopsylla melanoneura TaxID=428564 RepID=A0A8D8R5K8_9HEMI
MRPTTPTSISMTSEMNTVQTSQAVDQVTNPSYHILSPPIHPHRVVPTPTWVAPLSIAGEGGRVPHPQHQHHPHPPIRITIENPAPTSKLWTSSSRLLARAAALVQPVPVINHHHHHVVPVSYSLPLRVRTRV